MSLRPSLVALDRLAADPDELDEGAAETELPPLQYALHAAAERLTALRPPQAARAAHEGFADALALARDVTAELGDALVEGGAEGAAPLVWEWRGSLFRVRYARLRLVEPEADGVVPPRHGVLPLVLLLLGVAAVLGGALAGEWPVWLGGLLLVGAGLLAGRGQP